MLTFVWWLITEMVGELLFFILSGIVINLYRKKSKKTKVKPKIDESKIKPLKTKPGEVNAINNKIGQVIKIEPVKINLEEEYIKRGLTESQQQYINQQRCSYEYQTNLMSREKEFNFYQNKRKQQEYQREMNGRQQDLRGMI